MSGDVAKHLIPLRPKHHECGYRPHAHHHPWTWRGGGEETERVSGEGLKEGRGKGDDMVDGFYSFLFLRK